MPRRKTQKRKQRKTKRNFKKRGGVGSKKTPLPPRSPSLREAGPSRKRSRTSYVTQEDAAANVARLEAAQALADLALPKVLYKSKSNSRLTPSSSSPPSLNEVRLIELKKKLILLNEANRDKAGLLGLRRPRKVNLPTGITGDELRTMIAIETMVANNFDTHASEQNSRRKKNENKKAQQHTFKRGMKNVTRGLLPMALAAGAARKFTRNKYVPNHRLSQLQIGPPDNREILMQPPFVDMTLDQTDPMYWNQAGISYLNLQGDRNDYLGMDKSVGDYHTAIAELYKHKQPVTEDNLITERAKNNARLNAELMGSAAPQKKIFTTQEIKDQNAVNIPKAAEKSESETRRGAGIDEL